MAYLGKIPATQGKDAGPALKLDDISSDFDGLTSTFSLSVDGTSISPHVNNISVYLSGVYQIPGNSYSLSGSYIVFTGAPSASLDFHGAIIGASRLITPDNATVETSAFTTDTITSISGSRDAASISGSFGNQRVGTTDNVQFNHITASGNISASGTVYADNFQSSTGGDAISFTDDLNITGSIATSGNLTLAEYIYHGGDGDTFLRFRDNRVNLTAGGKSAIHYDSSAGKIIINNSNEDVDFHVMAEDNLELLVTDAANNRVGVNTTTPQTALTVSGSISGSGDLNIGGNITASGNVSSSGIVTAEGLVISDDANITDNLTVGGDLDISDTIYHTGDSNTKIRFPEVDTISFHTSGNERMRISAGGHITASGNISSSASIIGDTFIGTFNGALSSSAQISADISGSFGNQRVGTTDDVKFANITGSNDISASGNLSITGNVDVDGTSNFAGNVTLQNDLVVTGRIDAEEIHTTFISSSIAQATGSTLFGDATTDSHHFTGSVDISGSLRVSDGNVVVSDTLTATNIGAFTATGAIDFDDQNMTNVDIDSGVITGITDLTVADGGTGVSTLTDGGVLLGSGTSAITAMAVLTDGQMIVGDGSTDPVAESGATLRTSIGVGTTDDVKFANITGSNNISASGNLYITGNITGSSNLGANGDLYIGGKITGSSGATILGNVGIGVVPTHAFNLQGTGTVEARFRSTDGDMSLQISSDTDEGQDSILSFVAGTSGKGSIQYDHHATAATQKMIFKTGDDAVTAMTILGDGKVGIGRTNPYNTHSGTNEVLHIDDGTSSSTTSNIGDSPILLLQSRAAGSGNRFGINFRMHDGQTYGMAEIGAVMENTGNQESGGIYFATKQDQLGDSRPTEAMRIDDSGNVGIGTEAPASLLEVSKNQNDETAISIANVNTGTAGHAELLLKNSNGNVGGLRAHSSGFTTSNSSEADGFTIESYRQILHLVASNDKDIKFWNGTSNNVTFKNGGNVGIGETAPDAPLTISGSGANGYAISIKDGQVDHGMTSNHETDTYAAISKVADATGGFRVEGYTEAKVGVLLDGISTTDNTAKSTSAEANVMIRAWKKSGTGWNTIEGNGNIFAMGNGNAIRVIFDEDGDIHTSADQTGGLSGTYDEYNDAHLLRALDIAKNDVNPMSGLIRTKFDEFVEYNHETLAKLKLVGREKDGTPNHFINVTGMQRLHNGAIWQQHTEMEKIKELMYDTMVELIGKEQADKKLEKHDIKLLDESLDITDSLWLKAKNKVKSLFKVVKD